MDENKRKRLREAIDYIMAHKGVKTMTGVAKMLNVSRGYVYSLINGDRNVSDSFVGSLSIFPEINMGYIHNGEGKLILEDVEPFVPGISKSNPNYIVDPDPRTNKPKRFSMAVDYLLKEGVICDVEDLCLRMGVSTKKIEGILSGDMPTNDFLMKFDKVFNCTLNIEWLNSGIGEMVNRQEEDYKLAVERDVPSGDVIPNKYGDSPNEERRWCPVVPASMAKTRDFDILGHISKQMGGGFERLYSGTACLDIWHYVTDNDLYPYYQKGDCLGLKAYERGDHRIKTGNVYVVDTKRDGFIFRRFRLLENGDFESYTFNELDPQSYVIPQEDIIRVYSVVLMFRY